MLVQSFMWAEKLKDEGARAEAQAAADSFISAMSAEPEVSLQHLYSARQGVPTVFQSAFCQPRHAQRPGSLLPNMHSVPSSYTQSLCWLIAIMCGEEAWKSGRAE